MVGLFSPGRRCDRQSSEPGRHSVLSGREGLLSELAARRRVSKSKSYITTPIHYVNGAPHIGHAHTTVMGDILKRNRLACGLETKLTTGTDEHGQKNEEAGTASGMPLPDYLEMRSGEFQRIFDMLNVQYDYFVRTSRPFHMEQLPGSSAFLWTRD